MKFKNLPNILTVIRIIMVPIFMVIMLFPLMNDMTTRIVGAVLFALISFTDMLDGKIARKYNLVTDFGKFMDPLADKFMVIGAMFVILYRSLTLYQADLFANVFFWAFLIVIFRELAVTSMRLVVSGSSGIVVAANMLGKIKTCTQIACVICCIAEPVIYEQLGMATDLLPVSLATSALMLIFTLWSGINYIAAYWKYLDPEK